MVSEYSSSQAVCNFIRTYNWMNENFIKCCGIREDCVVLETLCAWTGRAKLLYGSLDSRTSRVLRNSQPLKKQNPSFALYQLQQSIIIPFIAHAKFNRLIYMYIYIYIFLSLTLTPNFIKTLTLVWSTTLA